MNTSRPQHRVTRNHRRLARRGVAVAVLLCSLVVIVGLIGVAWNVSMLSYSHRQLCTGCEAAALAGASELLDEDVLFGQRDLSNDVPVAQEAAAQWAHDNTAAGQPIVLKPNPKNNPAGDVVVGWVPYPTLPRQQFRPWHGKGQANSVLVSAQRTKARNNPVALWCGQLFGIPGAEVSCSAQASIDYHIYGFRPTTMATVPVLPLTVEYKFWREKATGSTSGGSKDNFIVDRRTGSISQGEDGIAEVELRANLSGSSSSKDEEQPTPGKLLGLTIPPSAGNNDSLRQQQALRGLSRADLAEMGGEFSLDRNGQLVLPAVDQLGSQWVEVLSSIQGQTRVLPLAVSTDLSESTTCTLTDFGAAVVLGAWIDTAGDKPQLVMLVQPTVMIASSALVANDAQENLWIAKLMLTQ